MALYEIQTMLTRHRTSLVSYGDFLSDSGAIMAAHELVRPGEAVEVRRGDKLIYRAGPKMALDGLRCHP